MVDHDLLKGCAYAFGWHEFVRRQSTGQRYEISTSGVLEEFPNDGWTKPIIERQDKRLSARRSGHDEERALSMRLGHGPTGGNWLFTDVT